MNDPVYPSEPALQPIECDQGADFALNLTFYNPIANSDPPQPDTTSPIDLTGTTFECLVKDAASRTANVVLTIAVTPVDLAHGQIHLAVPLAAMKAMESGEYYYDLSGTISNVRRYYLEGPFIVHARTNS